MTWYKKTPLEASVELKTNLDTGLSSSEANSRIEIYGKNALKSEKRISLLEMFANQFKNFMVIILIIAAVVSALLGEVADAVIILIIVVLNSILGLVQESKAEKSLESLKKLSSPTAKVIRDGSRLSVPSMELVRGDIMILEAGDFVSADGLLFEAESLKIEEAALTGESVPVEKRLEIPEGENIPLGDRVNCVFTSSLITSGRGKAIVTETGMGTEIGNIAEMLEEQEDVKTPLQKKLDSLGKSLGIGALGICGIVLAVGYLRGIPFFDIFMISVSLAVAAIPEGLPAIVTIVLSIGVQKMISKNAIIRNLPAVETLGTASVICSDKTGTLTQNKMTVTKLYTVDKFHDMDRLDLDREDIKTAIEIGLLCNDSIVENSNDGEVGHGDPTELALVFAAKVLGFEKRALEQSYPRVAELPFDSRRKLMSTVQEYGSRYRVMVKGAPDVLIDRCDRFIANGHIEKMTDEIREKIKTANHDMSKDALRVLGLAYSDRDSIPDITPESLEDSLVFAGLSGMIDPPRVEAERAVAKCKAAGIKPVMITGDHRVTAVAIAKSLGIIDDDSASIEGAELENMSEEELSKNVERYSVYARVSPEHKVRIVDAWQSRGHVVAMTGDGVNDAPALKSADIGCAMGIGGTDVSKQSSDMILTDDNFATIVEAVEEGRHIFDNIRKSIQFLLSCNIGEVVVIFISIVSGMPLPLLAIHILWINLVTDSLPALALGVDPIEPDVMARKPRDPKKSIFGDRLWLSMAVQGAVIGAIALLAFNIGRGARLEVGRTMAFATLAISQVVHTFNVRSRDKSIFELGLLSNKYLLVANSISVFMVVVIIVFPALRDIFKLSSLSLSQSLYVAGLSLLPLAVVELEKFIRKAISKI